MKETLQRDYGQELDAHTRNAEAGRQIGALLLEAHQAEGDGFDALDQRHQEALDAFTSAGGELADRGYDEDGEADITYYVPPTENGQELTDALKTAIDAKELFNNADGNTRKALRINNREVNRQDKWAAQAARKASR